MNKIYNKKIHYILAFSIMFMPYSAIASTIYIDTNHSDFFVGDLIMFNVRVNSENKDINAIEGSILLNYPADLVSLIDINTSNSEFSLWPNKPLPSIDNSLVSFAGGVPSGLNSKDSIIFNVALKLEKVGQIKLTPDNIGVYLNDGKGTRDKVSTRDLVVNILPSKSDMKSIDDLGTLISDDKTPPEPFDIYLGRDSSVFEGKKFLSFNTVDKQSDVAYYEVIEGNSSPIHSSNTYVLYEQNKPVKVTIIAYDSAGNSRKSVYNPAFHNILYPAMIIGIVLIIAFIIYKRKKK